MSIAKHGGRYVVRGGAVEPVEGAWMPEHIVIVEFPTMDKAREWYRSPDYAEALCVLGMADAALGNKEDAIREGRRAAELVPVSKNAIEGALLIRYLAIIYAWTGEKDLAFEQLTVAAKLPGFLSYGELRLHPYWDPLRGDPHFEEIVASLAPKQAR